MCGIQKSGRVAHPACWSVGPVARGRRAVLFRIALLHGHSPWVWHWWRACPQPLGPPGFQIGQWAPSVERGGGGNGWADGLTGGALRAGPEPPTKNLWRNLLSCCLVVLSSAARTQRAPGLSAVALANVVVVGRSPMANMLSTIRGCPRGWIAVLGRPHGGSGERQDDGSHQPARIWGEVRRWVVSGPDTGAGHPGGWLSGLDIAPSRSGCGGGKRGTGRTASRWRRRGGRPLPALW